MKHRFQLISILIFSLLFVLIAATVVVDIADIPKVRDNDNSVVIGENNENNHSDDASTTTTGTAKKNDKLATSESINSGDTVKISSSERGKTDDNSNQTTLAWDTPLDSPLGPDTSKEDTYESLYRKPFTQLYDIGVSAYLENNWNDCIVHLELAMHEFKVYRQGTVNCRLHCAYQNDLEEPFYQVSTDGLQFFDLMLKRTVCLSNCYKKTLKSQYLPPFFVSQYYFERFLSMRPYEYLQLCYYRVS